MARRDETGVAASQVATGSTVPAFIFTFVDQGPRGRADPLPWHRLDAFHACLSEPVFSSRKCLSFDIVAHFLVI